jgi:hypothetical protein
MSTQSAEIFSNLMIETPIFAYMKSLASFNNDKSKVLANFVSKNEQSFIFLVLSSLSIVSEPIRGLVNMVLVDEFESQFRRAVKSRYYYNPVSFKKILIVLDLPEEEAQNWIALFLETFAGTLEGSIWEFYSVGREDSLDALILQVKEKEPDLIVTRRCLFQSFQMPVQTLGAHVDVLTQSTDIPLLLLPHKQEEFVSPQTVLVASDVLEENHELVNHGVSFTPRGGELVLCSLEDETAFERYIEAIGKIPDIDSHLARTQIREQLLRSASEYERSCKSVLEEQKVSFAITTDVRFGRGIPDFREVVRNYAVNFIVTNTKDEQQSAMKGLAHALAVEFANLPALML